jgi:hypothetical protein
VDLKEFLGLQQELQVEAFHRDPTVLRGAERSAFILWNAYALEDEVHEATSEVSWKPWAQGDRFDRDAFLGELVDALHFLGNLLLTTVEPDGSIDSLAKEVGERYKAKRQRNLERQLEGYDGVSTKCPGCKRALDTAEATVTVDGCLFCRGCGRLLQEPAPT